MYQKGIYYAQNFNATKLFANKNFENIIISVYISKSLKAYLFEGSRSN